MPDHSVRNGILAILAFILIVILVTGRGDGTKGPGDTRDYCSNSRVDTNQC
jgi:hypothetical protein